MIEDKTDDHGERKYNDKQKDQNQEKCNKCEEYYCDNATYVQ